MNTGIITIPRAALPVPVAKVPVSIRVGTLDDLPFMDELQKKYGKALGYFPRKQFEEYIANGHVLVAEEMQNGECRMQNERAGASQSSGFSIHHSAFSISPTPLGYIISKDRYLKRDELGVIFQLCVSAGAQRGLIGALLVREVFARSAYGCRLYCLWCAQDLEANYFWEAMGFVPLAFRSGSGRKKRVHIFWQKKIDAQSAIPYWYPFKTGQGAMRADRVVFPVPPGVHWSEVRAVEVPVVGNRARPELEDRSHGLKTRVTRKPVAGPGPGKVGILVGGRIKYVDRPGYVAQVALEVPLPAVAPVVPPAPVKKRERKPAPEIDSAFLAKARELRDRYLEHVNGGELMLEPMGKYDVSRGRALVSASVKPTNLLDAA